MTIFDPIDDPLALHRISCPPLEATTNDLPPTVVEIDSRDHARWVEVETIARVLLDRSRSVGARAVAARTLQRLLGMRPD